MKKILLSLILIFNQTALAAIVDTPTLDDCFKLASQSAGSLAPQRVLYVFDIDNTVLALDQNLGSVQWFRWQRMLLDENITVNRVANSLDELVEKQGYLYYLMPSHTPEASTSTAVKTLQLNSHPVIFHTSRSLFNRDATERELLRNNLIPLKTTIESNFAKDFTFAEGQRPVSFRNGVYMSAGQDKGVFLNLLLQKTKYQPLHIVFVDDEEKNLKNVEREFAGNIETTLCRYSSMDSEVDAFNQSDKSLEISLWSKFAAILSELKN
jgi:hypothetical protein